MPKAKSKPTAASTPPPPPPAAPEQTAAEPSTRFNPAEYKFAAWTGGKSPKLFAKDKADMMAQLEKLSPRELASVVVFARVEAKPKVTIDLPGEGS